MKGRTSLSKMLYIHFEWRRMINWSSLLSTSPILRIQDVIDRGNLLPVLFCPSLMLLIIFQKRASLFFKKTTLDSFWSESVMWYLVAWEENKVNESTGDNESRGRMWRKRNVLMNAQTFSLISSSLCRNATLTVWYRISITRSVHLSRLHVCLFTVCIGVFVPDPGPDPTWTVQVLIPPCPT